MLKIPRTPEQLFRALKHTLASLAQVHTHSVLVLGPRAFITQKIISPLAFGVGIRAPE